MTAILENVYRKLADEKYQFTESEFSVQYLGKSSSYFAYLKCTGKQVSVDALLRLWGKLNTEHQVCMSDINRAINPFQKHIIFEWAELLREQSEQVLTELNERSQPSQNRTSSFMNQNIEN
jgi:hypothetical protein